MFLSIKDISYILPSRETLFSGITFSVEKNEKVSLTGDNGTGKSTLLRIIAGRLKPSSGEVTAAAPPYLTPLYFELYEHPTIAHALGIEKKLAALKAITQGSTDEKYYADLDDDWSVEERAGMALAEWGIEGVELSCPMSNLSGGEKTRVSLSGITLNDPAIILMDEPSNHLDAHARRQLYRLICESSATMVIVSHDRTLLNLLERTYVLSASGVASYGGNYEFFRGAHDTELKAARDEVHENEKALRKAHQLAREAARRKERRDSRGKSKTKREGVPRIMIKTIADGAAATDKRLKDVHTAKIDSLSEKLRDSRERLPTERDLRIKLSQSGLHKGKMLVEAAGVNFSYGAGELLWRESVSLRIASGDRIALCGGNGSGKTTLVKLLTGALEPTQGSIRRADFSRVYIDQEYSLIDYSLTVIGFVESHNRRNLTDSQLKTELHRFLFPAVTWEKPCSVLSEGEKMRLIFCALMIGDDAPDMFILDEPTNNLDISSLQIITDVLKQYEGTLIIISHDEYFREEVGISEYIEL